MPYIITTILDKFIYYLYKKNNITMGPELAFELYFTCTGTRNVIDACKICNVKRLIYTSSSVVVFDGFHGLLNVNESVPYPDKVWILRLIQAH